MVKIEIKDEVYEGIKQRVEETDEFNSIEEYVNFVLEETLKDEEEEIVGGYSEEEEELVKDRLRDLGYM